MQLIPIQSYYKTTLAQLFDNEGEVSWDVQKLIRAITKNKSCISELKEAGYNSKSKSFTGEQVKIIFRYISRPILNKKNKKLLKIENRFKLLNWLEKNYNNLKLAEMEELKDIEEGVLIELGLRLNTGSDVNDHYYFTENDHYYFIRKNGHFLLHEKSSLKCIKTIKNTPELINTLIQLKNGGLNAPV